MRADKRPEFRRPAGALARGGDESSAKIAADLGRVESCVRRWLKQDHLDPGRRSDGLTSDDRKGLAELRRRGAPRPWRSALVSPSLRRPVSRSSCLSQRRRHDSTMPRSAAIFALD